MISSRLAFAAALAAAVALPAAAPAATTVVGGPLKVRAYGMTLVGTDAARDRLAVVFTRERGRSTQQHVLRFAGGVDVTPAAIAADLGRLGSVDLRVDGSAPAGRRLPGGCRGRVDAARGGRLVGRVVLTVDATYFRTVEAQSLPARVVRGGAVTCDAAVEGADRPVLAMRARGGAVAFRATPSTQVATWTRRRAPATVTHRIVARGSGLDVDGPAAATVQGIQPFLLGTDAFAGRASGRGRLSGNLFADFDSAGAVALEGRAVLRGG